MSRAWGLKQNTSTLTGFSFFFFTGFSLSASVLSPRSSYSFASMICCYKHNTELSKVIKIIVENTLETGITNVNYKSPPWQSSDRPMGASSAHAQISHQLKIIKICMSNLKMMSHAEKLNEGYVRKSKKDETPTIYSIPLL